MSLGNADARRAWDSNARFWDSHMADGDEFLNVLVWPAVERLLALRSGARVLDVACGNGVTSRRLAALGARVVAVDFSEELLERARARADSDRIDYRAADATDEAGLRSLGQGKFDAVLCNMALMDIADHRPLFRAVPHLLAPEGRFVFSICHPCFNNPWTVQAGELEDRHGEMVTTYSVKVSRYMTPSAELGAAVHDQPEPHPYFHRSLGALFGAGFEAGLVVDALEERAFPPEHEGGSTPLSWSGRFGEIPPVLVARLCKARADQSARPAQNSS